MIRRGQLVGSVVHDLKSPFLVLFVSWGYGLLKSIMDDLIKDLQRAARSLAQTPGFVAVTVLTLALGIGATTAVLSVIQGVLLDPLTEINGERVVLVSQSRQYRGRTGSFSASVPNYLNWKEENDVFEGMAAYRRRNLVLDNAGEHATVRAAYVEPDFLPLVEPRWVIGRSFSSRADGPAPDEAVLTETFWFSAFGGDTSVLGRRVRIGGVGRTVTGVISGDLRGLFWGPVDIFLPLQFMKQDLTEQARGSRNTSVVARLGKHVALSKAQSAMSLIARRLEEEYPEANGGWGIWVREVKDLLAQQRGQLFWSWFAAALLVLFAACANVAHLMLARSMGRQGEFATRAALGGSRLQLLRPVLAESVLIALLGAGLGVMFAYWGTAGIIGLGSESHDYLRAPLDGHVLGFALLLSLFTTIAFGLTPALQSTNVDLSRGMKVREARIAGGKRQNRLRATLMISQIAVSIFLLTGVGLMVKNFVELQGVDLGFDRENLLTMRIELPEDTSKDNLVGFHDSVLGRIEALPGTAFAAVSDAHPIEGGGSFFVAVEGQQPPPSGERRGCVRRVVSPGYFQGLGIPLRAGRPFLGSDKEGSELVAVVSEKFAKSYLGGEDPVGQQIKLEPFYGSGSPDGEVPLRVIGVVSDVNWYGLFNHVVETVYVPYPQVPRRRLTALVRTHSDAASHALAARATILELEPDAYVIQSRSFDEIFARAIDDRRFTIGILGAFAGLAALLCWVGIYAVTAHAVVQRTHEIGIRIAIGASSGDVLRMMVFKGSKLVAIGLPLGSLLAVAMIRVLESQMEPIWYELYVGIFSIGLRAPILIAVLYLAVVLAASYLPARRAAALDPMVALRHE